MNERERNRRVHPVPSRTLSARQLKTERKLLQMVYDVSERQLPATRGNCLGGPRPCPYVSCKYHLYLDVNKSGGIKLNFPDLEPHEMEESCALDVADRVGNSGSTLHEVGRHLNTTRERVRQVEEKILKKLGGQLGIRKLREAV